jgi:hypothetical protein
VAELMSAVMVEEPVVIARRSIAGPCVGCQFFDACAQLNAICDAWKKSSMNAPWDASQRRPYHLQRQFSSGDNKAFFTADEIAHATSDTQARYVQMMAERRRQPDPVDSHNDDEDEV